VAEAPKAGRLNQKQRTRKDLLDAAARLARDGRRPTLEDVAEAALVSRATAYRYFPSIEALLLEAAVHMAAPDIEILADTPPGDPVARVRKVGEAFNAMIQANEAALRLMLARSLERSVGGEPPADVPARQNRRSPLIEAALEPVRTSIAPEVHAKLVAALALVIGTESFIVTRDVLRLSDGEAREVRDWAIDALLRHGGVL
jgi:AcrR family transcriptional regulator